MVAIENLAKPTKYLPRDIVRGSRTFIIICCSAMLILAGTNLSITKNIKDNDQKKDRKGATVRKPQLILHIGPSKTGTSTIQCGLFNIETELNKDNFYYIGSFIPHMGCGGSLGQLKKKGIVSFHYHEFFSCLNLGKLCKDTNNGKTFQKFVNVLEHHRSLGHNIIYSSEHLSYLSSSAGDKESWELLKELFQGFDVKVVFTYRHYFSRLLSVFNEINKQAHMMEKSNIFTGNKWPGSKARGSIVESIPSLSNTIDKIIRTETHDLDGNSTDASKLSVKMNVHNALDKFNEYFKVEVFLMEQPTLGPHASQKAQDDGMLANFLCLTIPNAKHSCSYLKSIAKERGEDTVENSSVDLEVDRLVTAAYKKPWWHEKNNMKENATNNSNDNNDNTIAIVRNGPIRQAFGEYLKEKKTDGIYPYECPLEADTLLQLSISLMHKVLQKDTRQIIVESQIRTKFSDYTDKHKICNLDVNSLLETNESEIQDILAKIRKELLEEAMRSRKKAKKVVT